eukprot:6481929-Amphidinium_carterae.5
MALGLLVKHASAGVSHSCSGKGGGRSFSLAAAIQNNVENDLQECLKKKSSVYWSGHCHCNVSSWVEQCTIIPIALACQALARWNHTANPHQIFPQRHTQSSLQSVHIDLKTPILTSMLTSKLEFDRTSMSTPSKPVAPITNLARVCAANKPTADCVHLNLWCRGVAVTSYERTPLVDAVHQIAGGQATDARLGSCSHSWPCWFARGSELWH